MPKRELSHEPMPLDRPIYEPAALNDLRIGSNVIRDAFLKTTLRFAGRNTVLVPSGASEPAILLIRSGFALCSCILSSGRRAILDLFIPGDVCGLFYLFTKYRRTRSRRLIGLAITRCRRASSVLCCPTPRPG
jgi:CRP-like cAMP-binding protein